MKVSAWLRQTSNKFSDASVASARLDALLLLEHFSGIRRESLLALDELELPNDAQTSLNSAVKLRQERMPLAYITKYREFFGHNFYIDENVLIPRPESEVIVEQVAKLAPKNANLIDVGTGSGALAVSIKLARPDLLVTASDVSNTALSIAKKNADILSADINFVKSNLLADISKVFDVVVANLPYLPESKKYEPEIFKEPELALFADNEGLGLYEKLAGQLSGKELLIVEHLPWQRAQLKEIFSNLGSHSSASDFVSIFSSS